MNIEIEIKIKVDSLKEIKKKIPNFGKPIKSIRQIDEYYVPCHRNFFAQKPHPIEWLRIRTNPDKVILEYDKSVGRRADGLQEYSEEYETEISQPEELKKILNFLDFKKVIIVDKERQYWNCGKFEVALDDVKGLGFFIEVEAKGSFDNPIKAREKCINFLEKFGIKISEKDLIKKGYPALFLGLTQ
ncbi:MAG TPA: class IV adenylate cyclase [Candidatus Paceibacterota bacterium]|nr:class IV adenylate cyclase [Candidatus Paceibacterota bacterium]